jgi:hypothetical protein
MTRTNNDVTEQGAPSELVTQEETANTLARVLWETTALVSEFEAPGEITKDLSGTNVAVTNPGLADTLLAEVSCLGHRDLFPRPYDWENLIPQLEPGEELLWMVEKLGGNYSIHLGAKFGTDAPEGKMTVDQPGLRHKRLVVLCDSLARRSFPESELTLLKPESVVAKLEEASKQWGRQVTCVAGVPSPKELEGDRLIADRDEETRPFASLNDAMEALIEEDDFAVVFSVAKASPADLLAQFRAKADLRDQIGPSIKQELGRNWSQSRESGEQTNKSRTWGGSQAEQRGLLPKLMQGVVGSRKESAWWRPGTQAAVSYNESQTISVTKTDSKSEQDGSSVSITKLNTLLEYLDKSLEASMKHLQMAMGTGGYYGCAMVYAADRHASRRIGKTLAAVLSGSQSHLRPMQILPFSGEGCMFQLNRNIATHALLARGGTFLEILDCEQVGRLLLLPDAELPGLKMRRSVFYGRPGMEAPGVDGRSVAIGTLAFARETIRNELGDPDAKSTAATARGRFALTTRDMCSHLLLVGTTGSGKTMRAAAILNHIPRDAFRILVLETAKKTYRDLLRRGEEAPRVYTLGDESGLLRGYQFWPFRRPPGPLSVAGVGPASWRVPF